MILSIGEILADMVGENADGTLTFKAFVGGAPFNVAVNVKKAGANVGFVSRIGKDVIGRFCKAEAEKFGLDRLDLQEDEKRNTTIAFVSLNDGERDPANPPPKPLLLSRMGRILSMIFSPVILLPSLLMTAEIAQPDGILISPSLNII